MRSAVKGWRGVIWVTAIVVVLVLVLRSLQLWQGLEWFAYDQLYQLRRAEPVDTRLVIVGIDESDIQQLKTYPLTDRDLTNLLRKINNQKPRVIGLDIVRDLPVEPGHQELLDFYIQTPNLLGMAQVGVGKQGIAPPPILKDNDQVASANLPVDGDGTVRRGFMAVPTLNPSADPLLSLGLFSALKYLETEPEANLKVPEVISQPIYFQGNDGGYVGADDGGDQVLINFRRTDLYGTTNFQTVSLMSVLNNKIPANLFTDRLVLVGITAVSKQDFIPTSLDRAWGKPFSQTAGVEVHAQIASHFLSAVIDGRPTIRIWSDQAESVWIALWALIGSLTVWKLRLRNSPLALLLKASLFIFLFTGFLLAISYAEFLNGAWIPLVPPWIALVLASVSMAVYIYVDRIRENEERFRSITETTPVAILVIEPQTDTILYANSLTKDTFGLEEVVGLSVPKLFYDKEDWKNICANFSETGKVSGYELPCRHRDLTPLWMIANLRAFRRDGQLAFLLSLSDVTTLKETEASLRRAEESYRGIFENAVEGIFQATPNNSLVRVNSSFAKLFGYRSIQEMMTKMPNRNRLYADMDTRDEFYKMMETTTEIAGFEYRAYRADKSVIWIKESTRAVFNEAGGLLYYEGIVEDVTQRRRQEEQLKRQVAELQVEIDESRRARQVQEITESDFFRELQAEADLLRPSDD